MRCLWVIVQADKAALQSDLAAAEERCMEAEKQSQAGLENEHATSDEVQELRRQLTEARLVLLQVWTPLSPSYSGTCCCCLLGATGGVTFVTLGSSTKLPLFPGDPQDSALHKKASTPRSRLPWTVLPFLLYLSSSGASCMT